MCLLCEGRVSYNVNSTGTKFMPPPAADLDVQVEQVRTPPESASS
jgi:hypothetical protein